MGNGSRGTPDVFGARQDRADHEVQFVGDIDFASYAKGRAVPDELSCDKVMPVNALRVAILQQERLARRAFRPREQEWLAQMLIISP
jgi:hypothetical protein